MSASAFPSALGIHLSNLSEDWGPPLSLSVPENQTWVPSLFNDAWDNAKGALTGGRLCSPTSHSLVLLDRSLINETKRTEHQEPDS